MIQDQNRPQATTSAGLPNFRPDGVAMPGISDTAREMPIGSVDVRTLVGSALTLYREPDPSEAYRMLLRAAQCATEWAAPPLIIQVEATRRCNLQCTMCPRSRSLEQAAQRPEYPGIALYWQRDLDPSFLKSLLDQCPDAESVMLHGIGEPLLHPQIMDLIVTAARQQLKISFFSNGTLLSHFSQRLVAARVSRITLSIDGASPQVFERIRRGARLERVMDGLRTLTRSKQQMSAPCPDIAFHITLCEANRDEVQAILDIAAKMGVCEVSISPVEPADALIQAYLKTPKLLEQDLIQWQRFAVSRSLLLTTIGLTQHSPMPLSPAGTPGFCMWPWMGLYVSVEGKILPCCHLTDIRRYALADANTQSIADIWNGEEFRMFRRGLLTRRPHVERCLNCAYYIQ